MMAMAACLALASAASGEVKTKAIDYKQGDAVLQGFFAWDADKESWAAAMKLLGDVFK